MSERTRTYLRLAALWAFPLALWLVATGWYGFDLGKYSDDWANCMRSPESGALNWHANPFDRWPFFWRPLHVIAMCELATVFWNHDWAIHLVSALAHLGTCALLYRVLRECAGSKKSAIAGAMLFMVFPLHAEAVLWSAGVGLVCGGLWLLGTVWAALRIARQPGKLGRGRSVAIGGTLAVMSFMTACWYEQAAAVLGALPLLLAARMPTAGDANSRWRRIALIVGSCGIGCAAYVALLIGTAAAGRRGSAESLVGADGMSRRVGIFLDQIHNWIAGPRGADVILGSVMRGTREVATPSGMVFMACVLACGAAWVFAARARAGASSGDSAAVASHGFGVKMVLLFGLFGAALSLLPIMIVRGNFVFSRYFYFFDLALTFSLVVVLNAIHARVERRRRGAQLRVIGQAIIAGIAVCFAFGMVGWQAAFRERFRIDLDVARQLREVVPSPPQGAVIVPMECRDRTSHVGRARFDFALPSPLSRPWSSSAFAARAFGRSDIMATHWNAGARPEVKFASDGLVYARGLLDCRAIPRGVTHIERSQVIGIGFDGDRVVVLDEFEMRKRLSEIGNAAGASGP